MVKVKIYFEAVLSDVITVKRVLWTREKIEIDVGTLCGFGPGIFWIIVMQATGYILGLMAAECRIKDSLKNLFKSAWLLYTQDPILNSVDMNIQPTEYTHVQKVLDIQT